MDQACHGAKTWVDISASALSHNIKVLKSSLSPGVEFSAVLKANAYGHDLETITRLCLTEGVRVFCVDSVDEGIRVRRLSAEVDIIVLGFTVHERLADIINHELIQTVYDADSIVELGRLALSAQRPAAINLKLETGTYRQGVLPRDLDGLLRLIKNQGDSVVLLGASSHFHNAEDVNHPQASDEQFARFQTALTFIAEQGFALRYQHICCSAAAMMYSEMQGTLVRFGIALYGLWSSESLRRAPEMYQKKIDLQPVLSWKTRIAQMKDVPAGDSIGYGLSFVAPRNMRIAVLPVGYYDGLRRGYSKGEVLLRGQRCPLVGTICMNMCMIDVSALPSARAGDTVTLLGRNGMHQISAEDLAIKMETINYEVVTQIGSQLPRRVI
jgi:alanine racemase